MSRSLELTEMVIPHQCMYDGDWDRLICVLCKSRFFIRKDMCDADGIASELERIRRIPCNKKRPVHEFCDREGDTEEMIENNKQYEITQEQIQRLEIALADCPKSKHLMPSEIYTAMVGGLQSQIDELKEQLKDFNNKKTNNPF